ncbi:hypothetical protein PJE062_2854 [Pseudovibrio sp. JE062]|nr:hypothetical protein PJE062_2854 [Pseudovibrio sp. JE062]
MFCYCGATAARNLYVIVSLKSWQVDLPRNLFQPNAKQ